MIRAALLLAVLLLLAGCTTETRTAARYVGTIGADAVNIQATGAESSTAGIDLAATIRATIGALRGDLAGLADAIKAQPPPPPSVPPADLAAAVWQAAPPPPAADPTPVVAAGGATLMAMLAAWMKAREAQWHRADADDAWKRLLSKDPPA
jgi:hypothetical protein